MEPVYAERIKIRKSKLYLTLASSGSLAGTQVYLEKKAPGFSEKKNRLLPFRHISRSEKSISVVLDTSEMETDKADWKVVVYDGENREENPGLEPQSRSLFPVILSGKVRALLILGSYQIKKGAYILFPMGSTGHRLILRCRRQTKYDGQSTRIKEFLAYGIYRVLRPFWKRKRIWIVYEKYCISAQDNGFYFFRYCMERLGKEDRNRIFFILDRDSAQWNKVEKYRKNVIPFMSFRHILYMLAASLYVASDSRVHGYLWQPKPNLISREINRHDIYFLQHGVLALKRVEDLFGKEGACPVTYFTASSRYEQQIIVQNFGYEPENVPVVGLARWDVLENRARPDAKKILVMPTWRSWLEDLCDEDFCKSDYYRRYASLMRNQKLISCLKENKAELIFYIHPKLRRFMKNFEAESSQVKLIPFGERPLNELLMECSMMVTDYSCACWDVYYQEKPVVFYQFDLKLYMETNGSYIDMEKELFGQRCTEEQELVEKLEEYIRDEFLEKEVYAAMRSSYFAYRDHYNCERTYAYIAGKGY